MIGNDNLFTRLNVNRLSQQQIVMFTIAVISQKGGAGKTTLAVNLAIAASHKKQSTILLDIDPQASASQLGDTREADTPLIMSLQATRLPQTLDKARDNGADVAIIDTAPHSDRDALAAAKVADLVFVPCRPTVLDLHAIKRTVDLVESARCPAFAVLNAVPPTGKLGNEASDVISQYGLPIAPIRLIHRAAYYHAFTLGLGVQEYEPKGKAASEVKQFYKFTRQQVNKLEKNHAE